MDTTHLILLPDQIIVHYCNYCTSKQFLTATNTSVAELIVSYVHNVSYYQTGYSYSG